MSGIITGPHFISYFGAPGPIEIGTMVSVLEIGAFVTSVAAGRVGDIIGRKGTLFLGSLVFTLGGTFQTFSAGFTSMVVGRIVSGFGVGLLSTIVPIYQSEISPPTHRGALACAEFTGNVFGYAFSVWTDYFCSFFNSNTSWRLPLFLQCVIGALLAAGSLLMPESPRWLIDTDKDEEGLRVLADLHGGDLNHPAAKAEFREIKEKVIYERDHGEGRSYVVMWRLYKRRVLLAMSSQAFAQLNGINVISYYAPRVFEQAGWIGREAILMTGVNALIYVLSTIPPWYLVDRWGRRPILLSGAGVVCTDYLASRDTADMIYRLDDASSGLDRTLDLPRPSEHTESCGCIMPLTVRAKGVSLSTCTNWAFNYVVGAATPWLQDVIHWRLYFMHAFFCMCSFMLVYFFYPETKGVALEDMDAVFGEGSDKMLTERRTSYDHEHIPFVPSPQRASNSYPPKPSRPPRRLIDRFFRPRSPYHPIEDDENEELMALNGEAVDVDKPREASHVNWTRD
ncbi:hypothetical protein C0995_011053 [Termitomyces sp. Mi166|nr:hypothetical protein C0995_011053 [Termitomyces sp. Mi166\